MAAREHVDVLLRDGREEQVHYLRYLRVDHVHHSSHKCRVNTGRQRQLATRAFDTNRLHGAPSHDDGASLIHHVLEMDSRVQHDALQRDTS